MKVKNISLVINDNMILKNISIDCSCCEMICIVRKSESGKSSLLNVISGLNSNYQGTIEISGQPVKKKNISQYQKSIFSIVFQD